MPSDTSPRAGLESLRVLVVEDDDLIRAGTAEMLRGLGLDITEAASGAEARQILGERVIDVLLIDVGLPDISGIELSIEACRDHPHLRVIIASGYDVVLSAKERIALPNVATLRKPYDLEDLRRRLGIRG